MSQASKLGVVAVLRTHDASVTLREACNYMNGTRIDIQVGRIQDVTPDNRSLGNPGSLLLEVNPQDPAEVQALERIVRQHFPKTPVVATAADISLPDIRRLMRIGVVDVLPFPIVEDDLRAALDRAGRMQEQKADPDRGSGRVITFLKGGGGAGATTVAVQSGCLLANRAKKDEISVCVMDLDLQFGTAALYLDLETKTDYLDLVPAPKRIDGELLRSVVMKHDCGLGVIPAPRDLLPLESVTPEFVVSACKVARQEFAYTLIDLPEVWTTWSFAALEQSDLIVIVSQLTVSGIRQTRRQLDTLKEQGLSETPTQVLLNRYEKGWGKTVRVKEAEKGLGHPIDHYVISDYRTVSEAINLGVPIAKIKSGSKVEKGLKTFVDSFGREVVREGQRVEPRLNA